MSVSFRRTRYAALTVMFVGLTCIAFSASSDAPTDASQNSPVKEQETKPFSRFEANDVVDVGFSSDGNELYVFEGGFTPAFVRIETKTGKVKARLKHKVVQCFVWQQ